LSRIGAGFFNKFQQKAYKLGFNGLFKVILDFKKDYKKFMKINYKTGKTNKFLT